MTDCTFSKPRKLEDGETLDGFDCGNEAINAWVAKYSPQARKRGTAVVYVSFCDKKPAGFYTLSSHSILRDDVSHGWLKRNSPKQIPAVLLGMMGVDKSFQGMGLGPRLLRDAILKALNVADSIGAKALILDPVDERAESFYRHFGFEKIPGSERLYIPLKLR